MRRISSRRWLLSLAALASGGSVHAQSYQIEHGRWFNGRAFEQRTLYVDRGVFVASRPARVDSVISLAGAYVVPPYGEAHNHNIEGAPAPTIARYLEAGIFYVKDPCSFPEASMDAIGKLNVPTSIDGVFAGGCLTSPDGHPIGLVRRNIARGSMTERDGDGRFLHALVDSMDFERRWPAILAGRPGFIKVILVYSEEHAKRSKDPAYFNWHGMDPALLPLVIARAHAAGLRVSAHIESAADFHACVRAGVDEINHMPGFRPDRDSIALLRGNLARYLISSADAAQAARHGISVVTTLGDAINFLTRGDSSGLDAHARAGVLDLYRANLRTLRRAGVPIALGSDSFRSNTVMEVMALRTLGVFSNVELLRMWSIATPRTIFPGRHLTCFRPGCEASFLALAGDPLGDVANLQRINMRMKQGVILR